MASIRHSTAQYAARRRSTPPSRRCTPLPAASRRQARCHSASGSARARVCSPVCPCCVLAHACARVRVRANAWCVCLLEPCLPACPRWRVRARALQARRICAVSRRRPQSPALRRKRIPGSRARQPGVTDTCLLAAARAARRCPFFARTDSETTSVSGLHQCRMCALCNTSRWTVCACARACMLMRACVLARGLLQCKMCADAPRAAGPTSPVSRPAVVGRPGGGPDKHAGPAGRCLVGLDAGPGAGRKWIACGKGWKRGRWGRRGVRAVQDTLGHETRLSRSDASRASPPAPPPLLPPFLPPCLSVTG